ncbi:MAG: hypothetical protein ACKO81_00265 [Planctomycetota bacterium]
MENRQLSSLVRVLQIISAAMIMGIVGFAIVTLLIVDWDKINTELSPLGIIALIGPLASCAAAFVLPEFSSNNPRLSTRAPIPNPNCIH